MTRLDSPEIRLPEDLSGHARRHPRKPADPFPVVGLGVRLEIPRDWGEGRGWRQKAPPAIISVSHSSAKVRLENVDAIGNFRPLPSRSCVDMSKCEPIGADPVRLVERTGADRSNTGDRLQREADGRAAFGAKLGFEPATRFIGNVAISAPWASLELDLVQLEDRFHREGRPGSSLTPGAMADGDA